MFNQKIVRLAKVLGFIFFLLGILEIWAVNRLSTHGEELKQLFTQRDRLILENQVLESEIAQKSALWNIDDKFQKLGLETPKNVKVISIKNLTNNE